MIEQLNSTIDFDTDSSYYKEELNKLKKENIKDIDVKKIRKERLEYFKKDIERSKGYYEEEIKRVNASNEWMQKLIDSLKED